MAGTARALVIGIGSAGWAVVGGGCGGSGGAPSEAEVARAEAAASGAADELMGTLLPELKAAMESGGAAGAIAVCAERAQALTKEVEARHAGVRIRRTALRVRNPANAPDGFERGWMERATGTLAAGGTVAAESVVSAGGGGATTELRYVRPIMTIELCVACHGPAEQIAPEVKAALAERYPGDEATGFKVGELRGVVSVRVGGGK